MDKHDFTKQITVEGRRVTLFDINQLEKQGLADIRRLPFSIKILTENLLRKLDGRIVTEAHLKHIANWEKHYPEPVEIPFHPARVLMQDFTGVPAVVDLAAMRDAVKHLGGDPTKINPIVPVELIIDHSVQIDYFGTEDALTENVIREYQRNTERYQLLKWAQQSFTNFNVVPPNSGICHQVNLEHLGRVVIAEKDSNGILTAYPDTLIGTDSHTPMINGIGVAGWGVGGIEAEAVMLGQPYYMPIPEVVGVKLTGKLPEGLTATDLVLTITKHLREKNVVGKFVEYFGPGMQSLSIPDRATIANMTPEYGATIGFFPVDEKTLRYLRTTNRMTRAELSERYARALGIFYTEDYHPDFTETIEIDLSSISPCVAGPARPQDRISLGGLKNRFSEILGCCHEEATDPQELSQFHDESGHCPVTSSGCTPTEKHLHDINIDGRWSKIGDGSIVIAAITSCTNTSNPYVMLGAGLLARNAIRKGLKTPGHVKTSLAPGSRIVTRYLEYAGLLPHLEALGFYTAGFGCTTCIGNSGTLHSEIEGAIEKHNLNVAAVLSGNRNFEARIHQSIQSNFLMSPILVVAFALAGRIDIDLTREPLAYDPNGRPVFLKDIWPTSEEITHLVPDDVMQHFYKTEYDKIFEGDDFWQNLPIADTTTFNWNRDSTYIRNPPYFQQFELELNPPSEINDARPLLLLGNSVTTDHISPAGAIPENYPAGRYLMDKGVAPKDFNSYGSRRGNHGVMMRGTFGNIRIKNQLVTPKEGSFTLKFPEKQEMYIFEAATQYQKEQTDLLVLGGREYGTGSSRDWAAKGTALLGIKAVIAESFERIHRSNLVGMGVLPLIFRKGESWRSLGIEGSETFTIKGIGDMKPRAELGVTALKPDGTTIDFNVISRLDTTIDVDYFYNNGILPYVLRRILKEG